MDRSIETRLIQEALDLYAKKETQYHSSTHSHSVDRYVSSDWFQRENEQIFRRQAMAVGVAAEVPNKGDYLSIDWISGISLLMVRDTRDQVRVFANACRHRGARLVENGSSGCQKRFICPYHAWTYSTEGELIGAPDFNRGFNSLDKNSLGLIEFDSRVIEGVVFIHMDPKQKLPEQFLAEEMVSGFRFLDLAHQRVYKRRSYNIKANWKILIEGGIEAYHFNVAHKNTLAPFFLGNLSTWEAWDHLQMRMILPKKPLLEANEQDKKEWNIRRMANIIYSLSPTTLFLAQPDNVSLIKMIPLNPNETRIEEVLLVNPPKSGNEEWSDDERTMHETNHNLVNRILMEDWILGEKIQANMQSGIVSEVHFGRFESALIWFHGEYEKTLNQT